MTRLCFSALETLRTRYADSINKRFCLAEAVISKGVTWEKIPFETSPLFPGLIGGLVVKLVEVLCVEGAALFWEKVGHCVEEALGHLGDIRTSIISRSPADLYLSPRPSGHYMRRVAVSGAGVSHYPRAVAGGRIWRPLTVLHGRGKRPGPRSNRIVFDTRSWIFRRGWANSRLKALRRYVDGFE